MFLHHSQCLVTTNTFLRMDPPAKNRQGDEAVREYLEGLGWHLNEAVEPPDEPEDVDALLDAIDAEMADHLAGDEVDVSEGEAASDEPEGA